MVFTCQVELPTSDVRKIGNICHQGIPSWFMQTPHLCTRWQKEPKFVCGEMQAEERQKAGLLY